MFHNVQIKKAVVNYFCFTATPRLVGLKPPYWIFCKFSNNLFLSYLVNSALHGNYVIILNTKTQLYSTVKQEAGCSTLQKQHLIFLTILDMIFGHKLYNLVKKKKIPNNSAFNSTDFFISLYKGLLLKEIYKIVV